MIYGSICSGIEAASVAWHSLGWRASFLSEIDPAPRAVLAHRYPEVPLHGDFTTIQARDYPAIDLLIGGTPCQDYSIAGKRAGLDGARGQLTLEFLRLAERLHPRWVVWENVPGAMSSNRGRDFGAILQDLGERGYGYAWRMLDAQYVRVDGYPRAVPQRRRRVFVVGYLGDWRPAAAALFEPEGLSGHPPPRRKAGEGVAGTLRTRAPGSGGQGTDFEQVVAHTLCARSASALCAPDIQTYVVAPSVRRLSVRECERLQGFPDDWTLVPDARGKPMADGPRYKMIGNSMAVNVIRWIGQRIAMVEDTIKAR